jgi:hypothetical protein
MDGHTAAALAPCWPGPTRPELNEGKTKEMLQRAFRDKGHGRAPACPVQRHSLVGFRQRRDQGGEESAGAGVARARSSGSTRPMPGRRSMQAAAQPLPFNGAPGAAPMTPADQPGLAPDAPCHGTARTQPEGRTPSRLHEDVPSATPLATFR